MLGVAAALLSENSSFLIPPLNGILVGGLGAVLLQRPPSPAANEGPAGGIGSK
ncbi:MAG: hypothetical protein P9M08_01660 [Candidatus Erginobacter occultus]|nr:hypothetical protein [Candidatus Erginobacter occultus]